MLIHNIKIDDYTELTLKIPEVMTPIELKALMYKANKIFNLSDVPINESRPIKKCSSFIFNNTIRKKLYRMRVVERLDWDTVEKELNIQRKACIRHIYYLKDKNKWNEKLLEYDDSQESNKLIMWTEEMEEKLYRLKVIEGKTWNEIDKEFENIPQSKIISKFGNMKFQNGGNVFNRVQEKLGGGS